MSYDKKEKRKKKNKLLRRVIIALILVLYIFRSVPSILANNAKTVLPEKGILIDTITVQGFFIKNETVIKSKNAGKLQKLASEGERLPAGKEIAIISSNNDNSYLYKELELIKNSIEALKKTQNETKIILDDKAKVEDIKADLIGQIQNNINQGNYQDVYLLKEQLILYQNKSEELTFSNTLAGQSLEKLESRKNEIISILESDNIKYYSPRAGIISYNLDGYEDKFLPRDFENYTYESLNYKKISKNNENYEVDVDTPICKIIDNFEWFLAMKVEDINKIKDFNEGDNITVILGKDKLEINGKIVKINRTNDKAVIVAKFTTMLHEFYDLRISEIQIILSKKEGYKIPTKAIIEKDSLKGVYIKDKSGIVKFVPVRIIGEDNNYTYVDIGDNNGYIKVKGGEQVKTINLYDEILTNTKNIKEGLILN